MDSRQKEIFGVLARAALDTGEDSPNYQSASYITNFLTETAENNDGSLVESTMLTVAGIAQLLKRITSTSDVFGLGMGDLTPFERLAESLLLGAALYGKDVVPVPDELPDLEDFKLDLATMGDLTVKPVNVTDE